MQSPDSRVPGRAALPHRVEHQAQAALLAEQTNHKESKKGAQPEVVGEVDPPEVLMPRPPQIDLVVNLSLVFEVWDVRRTPGT